MMSPRRFLLEFALALAAAIFFLSLWVATP